MHALDPSESEAAKKAEALLNDPAPRFEKRIVCHTYIQVSPSGNNPSGLPKETQWELLTGISNQLGGFAKEKLKASLGKNPNFVSFATSTDLEFRIKLNLPHLPPL